MKHNGLAKLKPTPCEITLAQQIASGYTVVVEPTEQSGFCASTREFKGIFAIADRREECLEQLGFMLETAILILMADGKRPPPPLSNIKRTEQINIRLSVAEKMQLEEEASQKGFDGISALVRNKALR